MAAVTSHAAISRDGEPSVRDMSAETMKMPEPIMEPMTMAVAEKRPMPWTNCGVVAVSDICSFTVLSRYLKMAGLSRGIWLIDAEQRLAEQRDEFAGCLLDGLAGDEERGDDRDGIGSSGDH